MSSPLKGVDTCQVANNIYQTKTSQTGNQTAQKKSLMLSIQVATKNHYPNMNAVI